jgi:hypothetical protein
MRKPPGRRLWFTTFIVAGIVLAVVLLGQTVWTYAFVSRDLVRREARRQAARDVTALERAIFVGRVGDRQALNQVVAEIQRDVSTRVAWVNVIHVDGTTLAGSAANQPTMFTQADVKGALFARNEPSRVVQKDNREILVYLFPLRLPPLARESLSTVPPNTTAERPVPSPRTGPVVVEIGIFRDAVSAQFGGLRRASVINVLAVCALLTALIAMAVRFPAYVRGRQTEAQLLLARRVQQDLLPSAMPVLRYADASAICLPAFDVGGDLFDLIALDEQRYVFLLGDVSGKNVSAALLMALVHGAFHGGELRTAGGDLSRWMRRLNTLLVQRSAENRFVTLFCGIFDARTGTLTYVNGGHLPPLLYRAGEPSAQPERLQAGGPIVGVLDDVTYEEARTLIHDGDTILLYSDGLTEATDPSGDEFGAARLSALFAAEAAGDVQRACGRVLKAVQAFTGREEPEDDQTVMIIRFLRSPLPDGPSAGIGTVTEAQHPATQGSFTGAV